MQQERPPPLKKQEHRDHMDNSVAMLGDGDESVSSYCSDSHAPLQVAGGVVAHETASNNKSLNDGAPTAGVNEAADRRKGKVRSPRDSSCKRAGSKSRLPSVGLQKHVTVQSHGQDAKDRHSMVRPTHSTHAAPIVVRGSSASRSHVTTNFGNSKERPSHRTLSTAGLKSKSIPAQGMPQRRSVSGAPISVISQNRFRTSNAAVLLTNANSGDGGTFTLRTVRGTLGNVAAPAHMLPEQENPSLPSTTSRTAESRYRSTSVRSRQQASEGYGVRGPTRSDESGAPPMTLPTTAFISRCGDDLRQRCLRGTGFVVPQLGLPLTRAATGGMTARSHVSRSSVLSSVLGGSTASQHPRQRLGVSGPRSRTPNAPSVSRSSLHSPQPRSQRSVSPYPKEPRCSPRVQALYDTGLKTLQERSRTPDSQRRAEWRWLKEETEYYAYCTFQPFVRPMSDYSPRDCNEAIEDSIFNRVPAVKKPHLNAVGGKVFSSARGNTAHQRLYARHASTLRRRSERRDKEEEEAKERAIPKVNTKCSVSTAGRISRLTGHGRPVSPSVGRTTKDQDIFTRLYQHAVQRSNPAAAPTDPRASSPRNERNVSVKSVRVVARQKASLVASSQKNNKEECTLFSREPSRNRERSASRQSQPYAPLVDKVQTRARSSATPQRQQTPPSIRHHEEHQPPEDQQPLPPQQSDMASSGLQSSPSRLTFELEGDEEERTVFEEYSSIASFWDNSPRYQYRDEIAAQMDCARPQASPCATTAPRAATRLLMNIVSSEDASDATATSTSGITGSPTTSKQPQQQQATGTRSPRSGGTSGTGTHIHEFQSIGSLNVATAHAPVSLGLHAPPTESHTELALTPGTAAIESVPTFRAMSLNSNSGGHQWGLHDPSRGTPNDGTDETVSQWDAPTQDFVEVQPGVSDRSEIRDCELQRNPIGSLDTINAFPLERTQTGGSRMVSPKKKAYCTGPFVLTASDALSELDDLNTEFVEHTT